MPEVVRVIIVDDNKSTRDVVRDLIKFDSRIEVVGFASNGEEAIQVAQELKPDVAIMDINMPDMDGITATERIRKKVPFTRVVILTIQNDPNYMRRAMIAGATDFLSKPPNSDDLITAILRAGQMAMEDRQKAAVSLPAYNLDTSQPGSQIPFQKGKIITVYSPKGGVGCTTIATNLAIALKKPDNKVIIVDGDLQFGDVVIFLNEQGRNSLFDLTKRAEELDPDIIEEVITKHKSSGVDILACPPSPELADSINADQFRLVLEFLKQIYNFVIVDTASYLTETVQTALEVADYILLITSQDIPSIRSCSVFLTIAKESNLLDRVLFVLNRYDNRIKLTPESISERLHHPIIGAIALDDRNIPYTVNRGTPFILENPNLLVSKNIHYLVDQIQKRIQQDESSPEKELVGRK
ncbi:MAG: response regulator [Chloroflexota bacterium]